MESGSSTNDMVRYLSIAQIVLALVGVLLLFTTPFASYDVFSGSWYNYGIWYGDSVATWLLSGVSVFLLAFIAYCGYMRGWASSAEVVAKYAKLTITLGLMLVIFSIVIGVVSYVLSLIYDGLYYYVGTVPIAFLVGGVLFMLIGFVRPTAA